MAKPSWDDAPDCATHLSMDQNGCWNWHFRLPEIYFDHWYSAGMKPAFLEEVDWLTTLEPRP